MGFAGNSLWDQLSEDWPSQPPSSPPQLPSPGVQPTPTRDVLSPKSRIPRLANKRAAHSESPKRPAPLAERSQSNINSRSHSSPSAKDAMVVSRTVASRSSAESSSGSVVKHKGDSIISPALRADPEPEWRQLALRKQDLFSPMALQGIFQKPDSPPQPSPSKKSFAFLSEEASMPSSPPTLAGPRSLLETPQQPSSYHSSRKLHDIVEEQDGFASPDLNASEVPSQQVGTAANTRDLKQENAITQEQADSANRASMSGSSSAVAYDFSPVYISKHNTIDGKVDYAALDPSELAHLGSFVNFERGGQSDQGSFRTRPLSPSESSNPLPSDSVAPSDSVSQIKHPADLGPMPERQLTNNLKPIQELRRNSSASHGCQDAEAHLPEPQLVPDSQASSLETVFRALQSRRAALPTQAIMPASKESDVASQENLFPDPDQSRSSASQLQTLQSIVGKKRKDARYDNTSDRSDPLAIAKRPILRPRNPTPGQLSQSTTKNDFVSVVNGKRMTAADEIRSRFANAETGPAARDAAKARALASEAATFRLKTYQAAPGGPRKQSVSTQDYINEAMKIMELIRARKNVDSDADSSAKTPSDHVAGIDEDDDMNLTFQTVSQPPSRDGSRHGWRSREMKLVDAGVLSHLKKYEETGDESFLVSSIAKSVKVTQSPQERYEGETSLLSQGSFLNRSRRYSDPCPSDIEYEDPESPIKTQRSQNSTDSAQTIATTSTQRIRNIATIGPENVSHLIRDEEAGMRFDTQRQTWVKCKRRASLPRATTLPSSSAGTDTEALNEIPDLSVNECQEQERSRVLSAQQQIPPTDASDDEESTLDILGDGPADQRDNSQLEPLHVSKEACDARMTHDSEKQIEFAATKKELDSDDAEILSTVERAEGDSYVELLEKQPLAQQVTNRRREQSVLFSSPPVSREWDANQWTDSDDQENADLEDSRLAAWGGRNPPRDSRSPRRSQQYGRARSLSRIEERHEISFLERGPNGRTLSMSLSISTPVPTRRSITAPAQAMSSVVRQQSLLNSLSPMSAFSLNQSDERHKRSIALGKPLLKIEHANEGFKARWAQATEGIVRKLTDVEPHEPYWDFMPRLNISNDGLDTLHSLDIFCPRLESLDASRNRLEHLNGAPASLRSLSLCDNALSNLTHWGQLTNLQYVDLSRNNLTSLEGFSSLVHLRELVVDSNYISSIDGILDLDGLLSLSLKDNRLSSVDFGTADLKRLEHLNISRNNLEGISGLSALVSLKTLDLSGNKLASFAGSSNVSNSCYSMLSLDLSNNQMTKLDITELSSLHTLKADGNRLSSIEGMASLPRLEKLFLRDQVLPSNSTFDQISALAQVQEIHLSGTPLQPCLPITAPLLQLQTLDVAFTGIQALPAEIGLLTPNLQVLNINDNHVKDLRPLDGVVGLRRLYAAGNRISRLRSLVRVLKQLNSLRGGVLEEIDLRGNPLVVGFYHTIGQEAGVSMRSYSGSLSKQSTLVASTSDSGVERDLARLLPDVDTESDAKYFRRLDAETKMKRRIYELLLVAKCAKLQRLDGLALDRAAVERKDAVWDMLVEKGVVQRVG